MHPLFHDSEWYFRSGGLWFSDSKMCFELSRVSCVCTNGRLYNQQCTNVTFSYFAPLLVHFLSLRMWSLFPAPVEKSALLTCSSTIHMKWQDYTRSLEHAVVITFKWAHATVPFGSDALEKLSTQIQSPHLEPHCPLGAKLHFLLLFINTHLKPKH